MSQGGLYVQMTEANSEWMYPWGIAYSPTVADSHSFAEEKLLMIWAN